MCPAATKKKHILNSRTLTGMSSSSSKFRVSLARTPGKSMRVVANQLHVSELTIRRVVHEDVMYKPYIMRRRLFISNSTRENCVIRSKRLLNKIRHLGRLTIFWYFSDENNFVQDQKANKKNDKWMCASPATTPTDIHNKLPSFVMFLGIMSNESHIMPLYSLPQDLGVISRYWIPLSRSKK